jgi:hypothetical protein
MKTLLSILTILLLTAFQNTDKILKTEKIIFSKKEIGQKKIFYLDRPALDNINVTQIRILGGHGYGFQLLYSDTGQSTIYYTNDRYILTPNHLNYKTVGWQTFNRFDLRDTILGGQQENGLYWKEIKKGNEFVGYLNIPIADKGLFDKSLETLRK